MPGVLRRVTARDERVGGERRLGGRGGCVCVCVCARVRVLSRVRVRFSQTRRTDGGRTNEQAALVDGSGGVCDYRGIRSLYIRIYRGGGGGGDYDIRGRRWRRSHGPQCAFSDGPGRAQETDRKHALPVHNGPMAAIQEHTGVSTLLLPQHIVILYYSVDYTQFRRCILTSLTCNSIAIIVSILYYYNNDSIARVRITHNKRGGT